MSHAPPPSSRNGLAVRSFSCAEIRALQVDRGVSLRDLVTEIARVAAILAVPPAVRVTLMAELADVEYRLDAGTPERSQVGSLVGAFVLARAMMPSE